MSASLVARLDAAARGNSELELAATFAATLADLVPDAPDDALLGAALASAAVSGGHVCVDLARVAGGPVLDGLAHAPQAGPWRAALAASGIAGAPGAFRPLVLDGTRLYLQRYWRYEHALAAALVERARLPMTGIDEGAAADALDRHFPGTADDAQKIAAAVALLRPLAIISGGPGTGKTSTVARILAALVDLAPGRPAIGLAAPTGKAAQQLQSALGAHPATRALGLEAVTVHRLLGMGRGPRPRYHAENPLPLDVLVVDEASMLDLAMAARLVDALPRHARLVMLGDRDQLASVEAGAVLASIASGKDGFSPRMADVLRRVARRVAPESPSAPPLADSIALLDRSYRFDPASGIGRLARAVRTGDGAAALQALDAGGAVSWQASDPDALAAAVVEGHAPFLDCVARGAEPAACFAALAGFRVLCAVREGPFGVAAVNRAVVRHLARGDPAAAQREWYAGRPVVVTRNDYALRLANGDVGVALPDADAPGGLSVAIAGADGRLRRIPPGRMPACETVYAMTVHKSQGSEFARVLVVLPDASSPVLGRELLYTAVTRATSRVAVAAARETLVAAVARRIERDSGLAGRLWTRL